MRSFLAILLLLPLITNAQSTPASDTLIHELVKPDGPGAAWLVAKDGAVIARGARGMADLEKQEQLTPEHVFRIGSITKQFTAVAILQLVEAGKLKLNDPITKYVDGAPATWSKITVQHLLAHTSGIKSYTGMDAFDPATQQKRVTAAELLEFFKNEPLEFEPGTKWDYNNSGYVLLGMILEKVSGRSYGDYVEEEIFQKLGMRNSSYGRDDVKVDRHATGYMKVDEKWDVPSPLSMTWPYAAGALLSTVDDLYAWNTAVMNGKLIGKDLLQQAHTELVLPDGDSTRYGFGWSLSRLQGSRTIEHGGGINGFVTNAIYLPEEEVYAVVLTNQEADLADDLSARLAAIAIGQPYEFKEIAITADQLKEYEGVYMDGDSSLRYVRAEKVGLTSQRAGGSRTGLIADRKDHFFLEGTLHQISFQRAGSGAISGLTVHHRTFGDRKWTRVDKPLPVEERAIELSAEELQRFTGVYELKPGFNITVTQEGKQLMGQATGQPAFELYASAPMRFFLKAVDAQIQFHADAAGKVDRMVLYQGGGEMEGKRVE